MSRLDACSGWGQVLRTRGAVQSSTSVRDVWVQRAFSCRARASHTDIIYVDYYEYTLYEYRKLVQSKQCDRGEAASYCTRYTVHCTGYHTLEICSRVVPSQLQFLLTRIELHVRVPSKFALLRALAGSCDCEQHARTWTVALLNTVQF